MSNRTAPCYASACNRKRHGTELLRNQRIPRRVTGPHFYAVRFFASHDPETRPDSLLKVEILMHRSVP